MTKQELRRDLEAEVAENAARWFADHVVTVEHEHGLYRHYRCANPGTANMSFHVVTFPGRLIVSGDAGDMAWERSPDMLAWAAGAVHSTGYFAEKVWGCIETREWSEDVARAVVEEEYRTALSDADELEGVEKSNAVAAAGDIRDELLVAVSNGEHAFATAYYESEWYGGDFPNVRDFTREFLRCREAVRWFLKWYKSRPAVVITEADACPLG